MQPRDPGRFLATPACTRSCDRIGAAINAQKRVDRMPLPQRKGSDRGMMQLKRERDLFQVCTWCGLAGIDAKPAVFYVDDIRLE